MELTSLGQWLMVDKDRLLQAERALENSRGRDLQISNVILGLSNQSLIKEIRENTYLIAVFAFIAGCTVESHEKVGRLLYEIMQRRQSNSISSQQIVRVVEQLRGYKDFIFKTTTMETTPLEVYDKLAKGFWRESLRQGLRIDGVYGDTATDYLAEFIGKVIDAMADMDNKKVIITGCRTGIWLACLLVWLRRDEVDVNVGEVQIYPDISNDTTPADGAHRTNRRLSIIFKGSLYGSNKSWHIQEWKDIQGRKIKELVVSLVDPHVIPLHQHPSPLQNTRQQIASVTHFRSELMMCIGNLATALVCIAVEKGVLHHSDPSRASSFVALSSICTDSFIQNYPQSLNWFGWNSIDGTRVGMITQCFTDIAEDGLRTVGSFDMNNEKSWKQLELIIKSAAERYKTGCGQNFLSPERNTETDDTIVQFAAHLATEALFFGICEKRPDNATYRPLEPNILHKNAKILSSLAFPDMGIENDAGRLSEGRCTYSDFMNNAWRALVQAQEDIAISDLAVSVGGYVIYQGLLDHLDSGVITDRRKAACVTVRPGSLKLHNANGTFHKLIEKVDKETQPLFMGYRGSEERAVPVEFLAPDGSFQGIDDMAAVDRVSAKVNHAINATEDSSNTLQIITYLTRVDNQPTGLDRELPRIPASWESSILAIVYAQHCEDTQYIIYHHLKLLVGEWKRKGYLGEGMQWCPIGKDAGHVTRRITKTQDQELVRFFEAGSIAVPYRDRMFIRPSKMPLINCVKEAMMDPERRWILIA